MIDAVRALGFDLNLSVQMNFVNSNMKIVS